VDRETHCLLSWDVVTERTSAALQACLERAPQAKKYYSDAFPAYDTLYYGAPYEMLMDKQETYSVEAVSADLRHYLKRLARKSRCFSRRLHSLAKKIQLFAYCYNHRQLAKRRFPKYSFRLIDFLCLFLRHPRKLTDTYRNELLQENISFQPKGRKDWIS
jgi:Transposase and inactivated derivatives, IS1 family